jgi:hypothetical protein
MTSRHAYVYIHIHTYRKQPGVHPSPPQAPTTTLTTHRHHHHQIRRPNHNPLRLHGEPLLHSPTAMRTPKEHLQQQRRTYNTSPIHRTVFPHMLLLTHRIIVTITTIIIIVTEVTDHVTLAQTWVVTTATTTATLLQSPPIRMRT